MVSPKRDTVARALATVSRHLAMLRKCGLVTCSKEGRWCHYRRAPLPRREPGAEGIAVQMGVGPRAFHTRKGSPQTPSLPCWKRRPKATLPPWLTPSLALRYLASPFPRYLQGIAVTFSRCSSSSAKANGGVRRRCAPLSGSN
jgi:hypothetical protein